MFKVYISDSVYDRIISTEEQRATAGRSNLYKLLKQQPVQILTEKDTERYSGYPCVDSRSMSRPLSEALQMSIW